MNYVIKPTIAISLLAYHLLLPLLLVESLSPNGSGSGSNEVCNDFCNRSTNVAFYENYYEKTCFCDECDAHGDCCVDRASKSSAKASDHECNVRISEHEYIYSIAKCQSWWRDEATRQKCEKPAQSSLEPHSQANIVEYIPVYSSQANKTFKSIYCLICNLKHIELNKTHLFEFESNFDDTFDTKDYEKLKQINFEALMNNKRNNSVQAPLASLSEFEFVFKKPHVIHMELRKCLKAIDSCVIQKSTRGEQELCSRSPTAMRYAHQENRLVLYKNKHCAKCNGVEESELECRRQAPRRPLGMSKQSLQVLFDLSNLNDQIMIYIDVKLNGESISTKLQNKCINESANGTMCLNGTIINITLSIDERGGAKPKRINEMSTYDYLCRLATINDEHDSRESQSDAEGHIKKYMTIAGQMISIISLSLLLIMYFSNKVLRGKMPGKILISLSISLLLSQLFFLLTISVRTLEEQIDCSNRHSNILMHNFYKPCYLMGTLTHYFYLTFFAWTNVMAYDLHEMFSVLTGKSKALLSDDKDENRCKYIRYSAYAWLAPLLIIATLFVEQLCFNKLSYGINHCFVSDQFDLLLFFIVPVVAVLVANVYYLTSSIIAIRNVDKLSSKYLRRTNKGKKKPTTVAGKNKKKSKVTSQATGENREDGRNDDEMASSSFISASNKSKFKLNKNDYYDKEERDHGYGYDDGDEGDEDDDNDDESGTESSDRKRLLLFLKLFLLTGMTWLLGLVSSLNITSLIWYIYIILNSLQGLFIFFAYAFNSQTKREMRKTSIYKTLTSFVSSRQDSYKPSTSET
jgi:hypothetical protein